MKIHSLTTVRLRVTIRALNALGLTNSWIANRCSIKTESVARLMGMGAKPAPDEVDQILRLADEMLPCLQPKPPTPIAERVRIARGKPKRLIAYAGRDPSGRDEAWHQVDPRLEGSQRAAGGHQDAVAAPA